MHADANPIGPGCFRLLHVNAPAALIANCRSATCWSKTAERDEEVRQLNLQYRNRLEYDRADLLGGLVGERLAAPVGSVDHLAAGRRNTPHPPGRENALLTMDSREGLRSGLALSLVRRGYGSWFQGQACRTSARAPAPGRRREAGSCCTKRKRRAAPVHEPGDARITGCLSEVQ